MVERMNFSEWVVAHGIPVKANELFNIYLTKKKTRLPYLSLNVNSIPLLEMHPEIIDWEYLSRNKMQSISWNEIQTK